VVSFANVTTVMKEYSEPASFYRYNCSLWRTSVWLWNISF